MSAESREKARKYGQKSGKGSEPVTKLMAWLRGGDEEE